MALTTYGQLKTAIAAWLNISATDVSSQIDDLITIGENRIFREARTRDMETALNSAMSNGVIALPSSYVALKFAYINTSPIVTLERRSAEWLYQNYPLQSSSGVPIYIARDGTNFVFGPYPDSTYTVKGIYYARLAAVSSSPNALFLANPDLYLMACLSECSMLIGQDTRVALWDAKYRQILADVNGEDKTEDQSGSSLQMRVSTMTTMRLSGTR